MLKNVTYVLFYWPQYASRMELRLRMILQPWIKSIKQPMQAGWMMRKG